MKLSGNWLILIVVLVSMVLLGSCFDPPQYSNVPTIAINDYFFKSDTDPSTPDSLIISVTFKDGDGDLGFDASNPTDTIPPYNNRDYYAELVGGGYGKINILDKRFTYMTYKTKRTVAAYDTLPNFIKPYNCVNWNVRTVNAKIDTFYFEFNPNHYNIDVDFLVQDAITAEYKEFDPTKELEYPGCGDSFNGRFPILSPDGAKTPLEGTIRYAMQSFGFQAVFSTKTLKLRITIKDRALNSSNVVETAPFNLASIRRN
jgi:hypothetical protein